MDCHGAARLAMTERGERGSYSPRLIKPLPCGSATLGAMFRSHCAPILSTHPDPVIARNEAIQRPEHRHMDCHGAARLAMTERNERGSYSQLQALSTTGAASALAGRTRPITAARK